MALLLHGDCLNQMKTLKDKSIDCFVCDLPYGCLTSQTYKGVIDKSGSDLGKTYGEKITWDIKIDLVEFWKQVKRLARNDHTPVLMFCNTRFGAELINSNPDWFRYDLIWNKEIGVGFLSANKQPLRSHELIYVFSKKGAYYKRIDVESNGAKEYRDNRNETRTSIYGTKQVNPHGSKEGIRCVKSVIDISPKRGKGNHPTQKPAELYKWLLERYCPPGGTMLDPTAGSFASVFTAKEMGLKAIGIEKDDAFFWKAVSKIV
jgi:site-specific DNA-methyltransferase (adenine-specific)